MPRCTLSLIDWRTWNETQSSFIRVARAALLCVVLSALQIVAPLLFDTCCSTSFSISHMCPALQCDAAKLLCSHPGNNKF